MERNSSSKKINGRKIGTHFHKKHTWTIEDEELLYNAISKPGKKLPWKTICTDLQKKHSSFKQPLESCIRRYKNYIDPSSYNNTWPTGLGFFIALCGKEFGYSWEKITQILNATDTNIVKDYFYSYMHKVIRHIAESYIPRAILDYPEKFFEWIQVLSELETHYFPSMENPVKFQGDAKDFEVIKLMKHWSLELKKLETLRDEAIAKFVEKQGKDKTPVTIITDLKKANIKKQFAEELLRCALFLNTGSLEHVINIKLSYPGEQIIVENQKEDAKEEIKEPRFKFPVYRSMLPVCIMKRQYPEPSIPQNGTENVPFNQTIQNNNTNSSHNKDKMKADKIGRALKIVRESEKRKKHN